MNTIRVAGDILRLAIYVTIIAMAVIAINWPGTLGVWLQKVDNARFEYLDCDCTPPLE